MTTSNNRLLPSSSFLFHFCFAHPNLHIYIPFAKLPCNVDTILSLIFIPCFLLFASRFCSKQKRMNKKKTICIPTAVNLDVSSANRGNTGRNNPQAHFTSSHIACIHHTKCTSSEPTYLSYLQHPPSVPQRRNHLFTTLLYSSFPSTTHRSQEPEGSNVGTKEQPIRQKARRRRHYDGY